MKKNLLIILSILLQTAVHAQLRGQARIGSLAQTKRFRRKAKDYSKLSGE